MGIVTFERQSVRTTEPGWQSIVRSAIRDPDELLRRLDLPLMFGEQRQAAHGQFSTFVPEPFLNRMRLGDPRDPLLRQVLPQAVEMQRVAGFQHDPVGDLESQRASGLIQKYTGRALLMTRGVCAVHCRYCFRRHFPYESAPVSVKALNSSLDVVRGDPTIEEIILSGGDPLMMTDEPLSELVDCIQSIRHVRRLRIHTRLPVVVPQRVTERLKAIIEPTPLTVIVVLHINHANEIDAAVQRAAAGLRDSGAMLLNQSVLLKGVNDDLETLVDLSLRLLEMNCIPYYLHQLDRVRGAAHFEVDEARGRRLATEMQACLPGYAVPRFVREIPGADSKQSMMGESKTGFADE